MPSVVSAAVFFYSNATWDQLLKRDSQKQAQHAVSEEKVMITFINECFAPRHRDELVSVPTAAPRPG